MGSTQLVSYNYSGAASGNYLDSITYGNGQTVSFTYDADHNLTTVKGNGGSYKYIYDEVGNLSAIIDYTNQTKTKYTYDADGNTTTTITNLNTGTVIHTYSSKDEQTSSTYENEEYYDDLDRVSSSSVYSKAEDGTKTPVYSVKYGYTDRAGFLTSNQTSLMSITANNYSNTAIYEYDKVGNITKAGDVTYKYDSLGQLVRVNDPKYGTTVYVYDVGGNIKYVKSYDYTIGELGTVKKTLTYNYDSTWKDKLTSIKTDELPDWAEEGDGNVYIDMSDPMGITYDSIGNPLSYGDIQLTWQMGRELASLTKDGVTYNYKYNYDGLRTYKSDGTNTYNYIWQDGKLISQIGAGNTIKFIYEGDKPTAINYNGTEYYYVTNLQGDIIAILDKNGNCTVEYTYDAWGKILSVTGSMASTLGSHNPLRYRGYCYDNETGFYYLQSRYYDSTVGRFINADEIGYLGVNGTIPSYNLFAYCENNPVNNEDPKGEFIGIGALIFSGISYYIVATYIMKIFIAIVVVYTSIAIGIYLGKATSQIKTSKRTKIPGKIKSGNKVKTPVTHGGEFTKNKDGTYTHKKTKWKIGKAKDGHFNGAEHWHLAPNNGKTGDYYNVSPEGKIIK